jgi:hypothetical protein
LDFSLPNLFVAGRFRHALKQLRRTMVVGRIVFQLFRLHRSQDFALLTGGEIFQILGHPKPHDNIPGKAYLGAQPYLVTGAGALKSQ